VTSSPPENVSAIIAAAIEGRSRRNNPSTTTRYASPCNTPLAPR
jgi:hypothetical protein